MDQKDYLLAGKYLDQILLGLNNFGIRTETGPGNSCTPKTNLSTQIEVRIKMTLLEEENSLPVKVGITALLLLTVLRGADQQLQEKQERKSTKIRRDGEYIVDIKDVEGVRFSERGLL